MQRDMKIGLSLGLLLVGIVGALFFRRADKPVAPPALRDAQSINAQVAERARSPYDLGEPDSILTGTTNPAPPPQSGSRSRAGRYDLPVFLTADEEALHDEILAGPRQPAPDPIPAPHLSADIEDDSLPTIRGPRGGNWSVDGDNRLRDGNPTHKIVAGDTLSSIATRYLGSGNRWHEIFDANRNVLSDPNRLPAGETIVIPGRTGKAAEPSVAATGSADVVRPSTTPDGSEQSHALVRPVAPGGEKAEGASEPNSGLFKPAPGRVFNMGRTPRGPKPAPTTSAPGDSNSADAASPASPKPLLAPASEPAPSAEAAPRPRLRLDDSDF